MTDQELKDLVASLAVAQQKTDVQLEKTQAQVQETGRFLKEMGQRMDGNEAKTDRLFAQTHAELKETGRFLKEIGQRMGSMSNNQGDVTEEFFYNSLVDRPTLGGIAFDRVIKNLGAGKPGKNQIEFDIVMHNGAAMAIVEVKYKVHPGSLDQVEKQMRRYRELFPEYKDYKLYGGVAGFSVPDEVVEQAHERGLFVLQRRGDLVETDAGAMRAF
jgi:hypothetical protein